MPSIVLSRRLTHLSKAKEALYDGPMVAVGSTKSSQRLAIVCQKPSSKHDDHTTIIEVDESLFWLRVQAFSTQHHREGHS